MLFQKAAQENNFLIKALGLEVLDKEDLKYLKCVEGDFTVYHGIYSREKPYRFFLHFIKSILFQKKYTLNSSLDKDFLKNDNLTSDIATILTVDHLYNDNMRPVIDQLSKKNVRNTVLSIKHSREMSFSWFSSESLSVSLIHLFFKRKITIGDIMPTLYLKYCLIPDCKRLARYIREEFNCNYSIIASAEVCDVFSRVVGMVAKENNVEFILLQCGPLIKGTNVEISSIICDYFLAWPISKDFLEQYPLNSDIEIKYFTPPRFYDNQNKSKLKENDVVVFLPWLDYASPTESMLNQIDITLNTLENRGLKICIKLHPHTNEKLQSLILDTYERFNFFPKMDNAKEAISSSKMVVNFGSTVSMDADYMMVKTAIINLDNRLGDDCVFFKLTHVMNIARIEDLNSFIDSFNPVRTSNEDSFELVEFIENRIAVSKIIEGK
jgi:hypothetical protein